MDHLESYKYKLTKDFICIYYPDYTYSARIYFKADTLVMDSKEYDVTKFWRFKN